MVIKSASVGGFSSQSQMFSSAIATVFSLPRYIPEAGFLNFILELFSNFEKCIFLHSLVTYTDKYTGPKLEMSSRITRE